MAPDGERSTATHDFDPDVPSSARVYDFLLGGKDNFEADRKLAEKLLAEYPEARESAELNREFLVRVIEFLTQEAGIRRFIDIGAGMPTQDNVHECARRFAGDTDVVYVDNDPTVLAHARALLATTSDVAIVDGDLRRPQDILDSPAVRRILEPGEPVGLLLFAVLHFIADSDNPYDVVRTLLEAMPPGSYLALTHGVDSGQAHLGGRGGTFLADIALRTPAQIERFFDGLQILPPGLVGINEWRPERLLKPLPSPLGAVGRKP